MPNPIQEQPFRLLKEKGYFNRYGTDIIVFEDFYPAGHQSGISVLMHGERLAANGDLRFEPTPGQWQPVPKLIRRTVDPDKETVTASLQYPDAEAHLKGFNPMVYPDCNLCYTVSAQADGDAVLITVDLSSPLPDVWKEHVCFNLELFPGLLFGKAWLMDHTQGTFPRQPVGPLSHKPSLYEKGILPHPDTTEENTRWLMEEGCDYAPLRADEDTAVPYAEGHRFTLCPEEPLLQMTVECDESVLRLYDGRLNHNNGWFVLSSPLSDKGKHALQWRIRPNAVKDWRCAPRVQISQVGYLPCQPKTAVIETDQRDCGPKEIRLSRVTHQGPEVVLQGLASEWGTFLRYRYLTFDFSAVTEEGLYFIDCEGVRTGVFQISPSVFDRGVWQPVLEYFLPVQMCHMRVSEKYRVWHGRCHMDDARMAPLNWNHFDGYRQGEKTLTRYKPCSCVPGLAQGGWHDAGDFDLRIESQSGEAYLLSMIYEQFHPEWDSTTVDQKNKTVEIHQPDGKNDVLEQIEHGALAVLSGWRSMGRLYRGIIAGRLRQYVLLGDAANMTENSPGAKDARWVFTENNPARELTTAAHLACISSALKEYDPVLSGECLEAAKALFALTDADSQNARCARFHAAAELYLTTGDKEFVQVVLEEVSLLNAYPEKLGWVAARVCPFIRDEGFRAALRRDLDNYSKQEALLALQTPYGVPYRPHIWGAGWEIQRLGCEHYFLHRAFPDLYTPELTWRALDFVLGCHPGKSISFASGIGANSVTSAYGFNRADSSFVPGGVVSGTALIRPDFPELKDWPYLWQQTEYVMGGGSTRFMFLVLAARALAGESA